MPLPCYIYALVVVFLRSCTRSSWTNNTFRLFFICECTSDRPHLADHEGYLITKPSKFMKNYGAYIKVGVHLLVFGLKAILGSGIPDIISHAVCQAVNTTQEHFLD